MLVNEEQVEALVKNFGSTSKKWMNHMNSLPKSDRTLAFSMILDDGRTLSLRGYIIFQELEVKIEEDE